MFGINLVLVVLLFVVLDRGRIVSPAYSRLNRGEIDELRAVTARRTVLTGEGA
jgi:hypothetical protein